MLAKMLCYVQISWEADGKDGQVLILGDLSVSREYKCESYRSGVCACP